MKSKKGILLIALIVIFAITPIVGFLIVRHEGEATMQQNSDPQLQEERREDLKDFMEDRLDEILE